MEQAHQDSYAVSAMIIENLAQDLKLLVDEQSHAMYLHYDLDKMNRVMDTLQKQVDAIQDEIDNPQ